MKYHFDTHFIKAENAQYTGACTRCALYMHISLYYTSSYHILLFHIFYRCPLPYT